ncbi:MAG: DNA repair protein RadC [Helicobacteraceae bacterium]|nr:DNA repair protein RadC [Helicobacteraceae bacterium]
MKKIEDLFNLDKPREKLFLKGASSLKEYELMAILLGSVGGDLLSVSKKVMRVIENKNHSELSIKDFTYIKGIGRVKAMNILAMLEFHKRFSKSEKLFIKDSRVVYENLKEYYNKKQEYLILFTLDGARGLIEKRVITIGILNESLIHPREVFAPAIEDRAASIILAHNHPSGCLKASEMDLHMTNIIKQSAELLGIEFLDHIIFTKDGFSSILNSEIMGFT